jgi:hypothetical protein
MCAKSRTLPVAGTIADTVSQNLADTLDPFEEYDPVQRFQVEVGRQFDDGLVSLTLQRKVFRLIGSTNGESVLKSLIRKGPRP